MHSCVRFRRGVSAGGAIVLLALPLASTSIQAGSATLPVRTTGPVSVTATRSERDVLDVAGNITIIDRETIENRTSQDNVADLLRREAGIFVTNTTTNPDGYAVDARGFNDGGGNGSSLLVLVDGRRINEADSSTPDWSWLRLDNVERIEVLRGPASALWGDGAVSGVINVITRNGEGPDELGLRGRFGSDDTQGGSATAQTTLGPFTTFLSFDGITTDGYRDNSDFRDRRFDGHLEGTFGEALRISVDGGFGEDRRRRPGALSREDIEMLGRRASVTSDDSLDRDRHFVSGHIEWAPAKDVLLSIMPSHSARDDHGSLSSPVVNGFGFEFTDRASTRSDAVSAQLQIDRAVLGLANRLTLGTDILRETVRNDSVFTSILEPGGEFDDPAEARTHRRIYGVFVQNELRITDTILVSGGVRFDHARMKGDDFINDTSFDLNEEFWSPRGSVVWRPFDPVSLYASYSRGFRVPNIDEAFGFFGFAPGLEPERSRSYETGVKVRSEKVSINVAVYRMDVKDQILFDHEIDAICDFGGGPFVCPDPTNINFDKTRHQGIEVFASLSPWAWLDVYGTYTYDHSEIRKDSVTKLDGKQVPITPRHRGSAGFRARLPGWIELGADARFVGRRYAANDLANEFSKLPQFAVYDTLVAFRPPLGEHVRLGFHFIIRNATNRKYDEFAGERTFSRGALGFNPSPARTFEGGVAVTITR